MSKNDGGQAFPWRGQPLLPDGEWAQDIDPGMTLRQKYAETAMGALMSDSEMRRRAQDIVDHNVGKTSLAGVVAHFAFEQADAMIAHEALEVEDECNG